MIGRKNAGVFIALILSAGLIASSLTAVFVAGFYNCRQFQMISSVSSAIIEEDPALEPSILSALKASVIRNGVADNVERLFCGVYQKQPCIQYIHHGGRFYIQFVFIFSVQHVL